MKRLIIGLVALLVVGACVRSDISRMRRRQEKELEQYVDDSDRFVDLAVELRVVVADPSLGKSLVDGAPLLRVVRTHRFGGWADTKSTPPRLIGPSDTPVVWHCSEDQERVILHDDGETLGLLVYGSEGAGKTVALAMWHYLRWLEHFGEQREGGQTAPTTDRLDLIRKEMFKLYPAEWYRHKVADDIVVFCDGTSVRLVSTYQQSKAQGSPIQGFNWSWCGRDEGQDQVERHEDIESRGRAAKHGRYKQLITATAKDATAWRELRDVLLKSGLWTKLVMLGKRSPFIEPSFWKAKLQSMTKREYERRVLAMDVGPELMIYHTYLREKNLVSVPDHWVDVTADELAKWGRNLTVLVGHDPGLLCDVSIFLKAYRFGRAALPVWVVVGEVTTERTTTEQHVTTMLAYARDRWGVNLIDRNGKVTADGPRMLVRADPYGNNDSKPDRACYTVFRQAGITIHPGAYSDDGKGPGRVPKEAGIDVVCTLFCNAAGGRRLYIANDNQGRAVAPGLVKAIESAERSADGKAETEKKNKYDLSHWPAALRYALWVIERPRVDVQNRVAA